MSSKQYTYLAALDSVVIVYFFIRMFFFETVRTLRNDVVQGILIGIGLGFITVQILGRIKATKINGWTTMYGCGKSNNGFVFRAACAQIFPGPINEPAEAMYWTTNVDGAGQTLNGEHEYVMHFPPEQLPPNNAFWSLTMGDTKNRFVENPINRYSVSDRSELVPNDDGSVDIYIQNAAPVGKESNWLPAPGSGFILWLRVYQPGEAILNRSYKVPPVEVKRDI